jgi:hypothetical protein
MKTRLMPAVQAVLLASAGQLAHDLGPFCCFRSLLTLSRVHLDVLSGMASMAAATRAFAAAASPGGDPRIAVTMSAWDCREDAEGSLINCFLISLS